MADEKLTVVVNRSQAKSFHLKGGRVLGPGESMEVSGKEAVALLRYREIVDAAKLKPKPAAKAAADEDEGKTGKGKK